MISGLNQESNSNDQEHARLEHLNSTLEHQSSPTVRWMQALLLHDRTIGFQAVRRDFYSAIHKGLDIPSCDTPDAGIIWGTLLKYERLVPQVINYAADMHRRRKGLYPHLYEKCIAYWLPRNVALAVRFHRHIEEKLRLEKLPLRRIAESVNRSLSDDGVVALLKIYYASKECDLYDEMVPALSDQGKFFLARQWHAVCLLHKDLPSPAVASYPKIQALMKQVPPLSQERFLLRVLGREQGKVTPKYSPKYNGELLRRFAGRYNASVRFDDAFCAKLFATKAFSPASVIRGLVMTGVNEIGPQAVRHMGLRTESIPELSDHFRLLKESGIALKGCVFSLALEKFAMEGKHSLARSILDSDQHPDVFDDAQQQRNLLSYYISQEDWIQAHRTLAILSLFHNDSTSESWNIMLREYVGRLDTKGVTDALEYMSTHGILVSEKSMAALRNVLRPRRKGRRPRATPKRDLDVIGFLARCYMKILESGIGFVYPVAWKEIVTRLGKLGRLREMRRLLFWLLSWYGPRSTEHMDTLPFRDAADMQVSHLYHDDRACFRQRFPDALRALFPKSLQQALIVWGFRAGLLPDATLEQSMLSSPASKKNYRNTLLWAGTLDRLPWSYGLQMLVDLRDNGVRVHETTVRKALSVVFISLFAKGRSHVIANRIMEDVNTEPIDWYIRQVNEIWGSPLFRTVDAARSEADEGIAAGDGASSIHESTRARAAQLKTKPSHLTTRSLRKKLKYKGHE
jgi:uncharacterized protein YjeT (DUF2065 family)